MTEPKAPEYPKSIEVTATTPQHEKEILAAPPVPTPEAKAKAVAALPPLYPKKMNVVVVSAEHEKQVLAGPQYPKKISVEVSSKAHEAAVLAVADPELYYVPVEYPKWVGGVVVENAEAEQKLVAKAG